MSGPGPLKRLWEQALLTVVVLYVCGPTVVALAHELLIPIAVCISVLVNVWLVLYLVRRF